MRAALADEYGVCMVKLRDPVRMRAISERVHDKVLCTSTFTLPCLPYGRKHFAAIIFCWKKCRFTKISQKRFNTLTAWAYSVGTAPLDLEMIGFYTGGVCMKVKHHITSDIL